MRKKFLAGLLALVMLLSLLPVTAFAADGDVDSTETKDAEGLVASKVVTVQPDGSFDITLEAYATGTVTTSTESVPCDIVLLLDQSGSMSDVLGTQTTENFTEASIWLLLFTVNVNKVSTANLVQNVMTLYVKNSDGTYSAVDINESDGTYTVTKQDNDEVVYSGADTDMQFYRYQTSTTETSKQEGLMTAAKAFVEATGDKNDAITEEDQKHRISIVKFAGTETENIGNDTYKSGSYTYNYTQIVQELTSDEATLLSTLNSLSEAGATSADYGMNRAAAALGDLTTDDGRKKIIIMFTDGEPNHGNGFDDSVAAATINKAEDLKSQGVTIYTIGVLSGANPALDPTLTSTSDVNKYLHAVSSNYPSATATDAFVVTWGTGDYTNGYYKTATTSSELNSIFQEIQNSVGSTSVTLDATAVMKDIVSDNFVLPEGFNGENSDAKVTVETVDYAGNGTFDETTRKVLESAVVTITGNTIDVKGFAYASNYCVDASGTVATSGKKLCVTITGLELNPDNYVEGEVYTNGAASGIYDQNGNIVEHFHRPSVILGKKSYVVDYAKPFNMNMSEWNQDDVDHLALTPSAFTDPNLTGLNLTYGKVTATETTGVFTYTPQTTNWGGYDTFYSFGHNHIDTDEFDLWSQVNVIPANNVYYEDDFIAQGSTTDATDDDVVGIEYGGNWSITTGTGNNTETPNGAVQGWESSLSDDAAFSDGTAHVASTNGATATFTFTGTGVDIYSYTDINSGIVVASLYKDGQTVANKTLMVDNLAVSGEYYQIPTLSFGPDTTITVKNEDGSTSSESMAYGTYTVKITVTSGKAVETDDDGKAVVDEDGNLVYSDTAKRSTYYLDGIRVYNPLGNDTTKSEQPVSDSTVQEAYGETELNAMFTEVRDILATTDDGSSAVFTDLDGEGNTTAADYEASEYGIYGPKNEVYLAKGQSITFKVADLTHSYQIGLKAPEGATTATWTGYGEYNYTGEISHSTDLYYKTTPTDEGFITITNSGEKLLSVTKIKTTNAAATATLMLADLGEDEAVAEVAAFSLRSTVAYSVEPEEETPEVTEPETPEVTEPETPEVTEPETPDEPTEPEVPDIDIEIENPEPKPEQKPVQKPNHNENLKKLVNNLFNKIFGWFGR